MTTIIPQSDLTPFSRAEALAFGFVPRTGTVNLMAHVRYPGFLFRLVTDMQQALACGGVLTTKGSRRQFYFGLDLGRAAADGCIGQQALPTRMSRVAWMSPDRTQVDQQLSGGPSTPGQITVTTRVSILHIPDEDRWSAWNTSASKYIGVVSKADGGYIIDHVGPIAAEETFNVFQVSIPPLVQNFAGWADFATKGTLVNGELQYIDLGSGGAVTLTTAVTSGYITNTVQVPRRAWLSAAEQGYLNQIENSDVKGAYASAYAELKASPENDGFVADEFSFYPTIFGGQMLFNSWEAVSSVFSYGEHKRPASLSPPGLFFAYSAQVFSESRVVSPYGYQPSYDTLTHAMDGNRSCRSRSGRPYARLVAGTFSGGSVTGGDDFSAMDLNPSGATLTNPVLPDGLDRFPLSAIPFVDVKVYQGMKLKASSVFSPLSPMAMPSVAPTDTLDLSLRMNFELGEAGKSLPVGLALPPQGADPVSLQIASGFAKSALESMSGMQRDKFKYLSPFTLFVTKFIVDLDDKVRNSQ